MWTLIEKIRSLLQRQSPPPPPEPKPPRREYRSVLSRRVDYGGAYFSASDALEEADITGITAAVEWDNRQITAIQSSPVSTNILLQEVTEKVNYEPSFFHDDDETTLQDPSALPPVAPILVSPLASTEESSKLARAELENVQAQILQGASLAKFAERDPYVLAAAFAGIKDERIRGTLVKGMTKILSMQGISQLLRFYAALGQHQLSYLGVLDALLSSILRTLQHLSGEHNPSVSLELIRCLSESIVAIVRELPQDRYLTLVAALRNLWLKNKVLAQAIIRALPEDVRRSLKHSLLANPMAPTPSDDLPPAPSNWSDRETLMDPKKR